MRSFILLSTLFFFTLGISSSSFALEKENQRNISFAKIQNAKNYSSTFAPTPEEIIREIKKMIRQLAREVDPFLRGFEREIDRMLQGLRPFLRDFERQVDRNLRKMQPLFRMMEYKTKRAIRDFEYLMKKLMRRRRRNRRIRVYPKRPYSYKSKQAKKYKITKIAPTKKPVVKEVAPTKKPVAKEVAPIKKPVVKEVAPTKSAGGIPSKKEQLVLAQKAISDFNHAIQTNDFITFQKTFSKRFQKLYSADRLKKVFRVFQASKEKMKAIKKFNPVIISARMGRSKPYFYIVGYYPTTPEKVRFSLTYIQENQQWKLLGIQVRIF